MISAYLKMPGQFFTPQSQNQRFFYRNYLTTTISFAPDVKQIKISPLLLQPMVENAVKYGKQTAPGGLNIHINATRPRPGRLLFEVTNTGNWVPTRRSNNQAQSTGIGLKNLKERLETLYPGDYEFKVTSGNDLVTISIEIPVEKERTS